MYGNTSIKLFSARSGLFAVAAAALLLSGCSKELKNAGSKLGNPGAGAYGPVTPGTNRDFAVNVGDKVLFETDSAQLTGEARSILTAQARWLKKYPNYTITVEGHADERGTREYNLGLGGRRALSVKNFLISQGVRPARLRSISYGKERPVSVCNDISCWSQNRRGVTLLNRRG